MIELTLEDTKALAREVIAQFGEDYVYNRHGRERHCAYTDFDHNLKRIPSCVVGQVLHLAGVSLDAIAREEGNDSNAALASLHYRGVLTIDEGAVHFLKNMQYSQDGGASWGEAYTHAVEDRIITRHDGVVEVSDFSSVGPE